LSAPAIALDDVARRARRRTTLRLLPYVLLLYVIAYLDRNNLATAALQMPWDGFRSSHSDGNYGALAGWTQRGFSGYVPPITSWLPTLTTVFWLWLCLRARLIDFWRRLVFFPPEHL
jgi:hypothetical protein